MLLINRRHYLRLDTRTKSPFSSIQRCLSMAMLKNNAKAPEIQCTTLITYPVAPLPMSAEKGLLQANPQVLTCQSGSRFSDLTMLSLSLQHTFRPGLRHRYAPGHRCSHTCSYSSVHRSPLHLLQALYQFNEQLGGYRVVLSVSLSLQRSRPLVMTQLMLPLQKSQVNWSRSLAEGREPAACLSFLSGWLPWDKAAAT